MAKKVKEAPKEKIYTYRRSKKPTAGGITPIKPVYGTKKVKEPLAKRR